MITIDLEQLARVTGGEDPKPPVDCRNSDGFINFCGGEVNIGNTNGNGNTKFQVGPVKVGLPF